MGGGGTGAVLRTYLGSKGNVTKVDVIVGGTGYYSAPSVTIKGNLVEGGKHATFSVQLAPNPVRGITTKVKFDRTAGVYVYTKTEQTQTFTASGSQFAFNLNWPMDLKVEDVSITKNNTEMLSNEYPFKNVKDENSVTKDILDRLNLQPALTGDVIVINYKLSQLYTIR